MIEIIFLGTSSGIPSVSRAFPSIAIKDLRSGDICLFDVGEGTQREILRHGLGLAKIKNIFISHVHIDHFLGLYGLIETYRVYNIPLPNIYIPERIPYLGTEFDFRFIRSNTLVENSDYSVSAFRVKHIRNSYGFLFQTKGRRKFIEEKTRDFTDRDFMNLRIKGFTIRGDRTIRLEDVTYEVPGIRVFYTGDTMYFEDLAKELGKVNILIHDSTFLNEDEEARSKRHSTAQEAIAMAQRLDAELLILTHISNKYEHIPANILLNKLDIMNRKVVIAHDGMRVNIKREDNLKISII